MNKITGGLKLAMQGPAVAALQNALQLCLDRGLFAARDGVLVTEFNHEKASETFGNATARLVSMFRESHNLRPSGEVDEATANALNEKRKGVGSHFDSLYEMKN